MEPLYIFLSVLFSIFSLFTAFSNAFVAYTFYKVKTLRTAGNYFILSLAVTDFIVGAVLLPIFSYYVITGDVLFGAPYCDVWETVEISVCTVSANSLLLICIDRFWSLKFPFHHRTKLTRKVAVAVIGLTWLLSFAVWSVITVVYRKFLSGHVSMRDWCSNSLLTRSATAVSAFISVAFYIPFIFMAVLYALIYRMVSVRQKAMQDSRHSRVSRGGGTTRSYAFSDAHMKELAEAAQVRSSVSGVPVDADVYAASAKSLPVTSYGSMEQKRTASGNHDTGDLGDHSLTRKLSLRNSAVRSGLYDEESDSGADERSVADSSIVTDSPATIATSTGTNAFESISDPSLCDRADSGVEQSDVSIILEPPSDFDKYLYERNNNVGKGAETVADGDEIGGTETIADGSDTVADGDENVANGDETGGDSRFHSLDSLSGGPGLLRTNHIPPSAAGEDKKPTQIVSLLDESAIQTTMLKPENLLGNSNIGSPTLTEYSSCESLAEVAPVHPKNAGQGSTYSSQRPILNNATRSASEYNNTLSVNEKSKRRVVNSENVKAARLLTTILVAFVITWLPGTLFITINNFVPSAPVPLWLYQTGYIICYLNSLVNPILYALSSKSYRRAFRKVFRGITGRAPTEENSRLSRMSRSSYVSPKLNVAVVQRNK